MLLPYASFLIRTNPDESEMYEASTDDPLSAQGGSWQDA